MINVNFFNSGKIVIILNFKVIPNSKIEKIEVLDDIIKVSLAVVPERGKANKAFIQLLSKILRLPQSSFLITSGLTTRNKKVKIATNLTKEELVECLSLNG